MDELVGTTEPSLVPRLSREKHVEFKQQSLLMQNNKEFDSEMMITVIFALRTFGRKCGEPVKHPETAAPCPESHDEAVDT